MLSTSIGKEGVIQNAKDGINATLKSIGKRYDAMELTIEATMARYKSNLTIWISWSLNSMVRPLI